jgi:hypothetical protein
MKRQPGRHQGDEALSKENPDLVDDPAGGDESLEQFDTSLETCNR